MKKWFPLLVVLLLLLASGCQSVQPASAEAPPEIASLHREVQLLNLINGLELMPDQMRFIIEKAQETQELREELQAGADTEEMAGVLEQFKATLMAGENIPADLAEQWHAVEGRLHAAKDDYEAELVRIAGEVEEVLGEHQLYALEQYVPCVVPPKGELRVGQAQDTGGGEAVLKRLWAIPDDQFKRHEEKIARRVLERIREHLHGAALILDEEAELERIEGLMEEAYEAVRPAVEPTAVIARHLLDPAIIPLLEEKLALVEK